jgi:hypothetical protein
MGLDQIGLVVQHLHQQLGRRFLGSWKSPIISVVRSSRVSNPAVPAKFIHHDHQFLPGALHGGQDFMEGHVLWHKAGGLRPGSNGCIQGEFLPGQAVAVDASDR